MRKDVGYYERKLRKMICQRRNVEEVEPWLDGQIHAAAMNWQMLEKVHEQIMDEDELVMPVTGSMSQTKYVVTPLLPMYKELQRTMLLHYEALGLNFKTAPKKMTENASKGGVSADDPLSTFFESVK